MFNIEIITINHDEQDYPTVGNWQWTPHGNLKIYVSNMDNWKYEFLVAFHEMIETVLCRDRDISQKEVDAFDKTFEYNRAPDDLSEPGDDPKAPYKKEHFFATTLERMMASELGVDWKTYDEKVASL